MSELQNVYFLENQDFDANGNLVGFAKLGKPTKPCLVLVYASWCGHCKTFKPEFQKFANRIKSMGEPLYVCAIQADGKRTPEEMELSKKIKQLIPGFMGFPDCCLYVDGKVSKKFQDQRTEAALMKFCGM